MTLDFLTIYIPTPILFCRHFFIFTELNTTLNVKNNRTERLFYKNLPKVGRLHLIFTKTRTLTTNTHWKYTTIYIYIYIYIYEYQL